MFQVHLQFYDTFLLLILVKMLLTVMEKMDSRAELVTVFANWLVARLSDATHSAVCRGKGAIDQTMKKSLQKILALEEVKAARIQHDHDVCRRQKALDVVQ